MRACFIGHRELVEEFKVCEKIDDIYQILPFFGIKSCIVNDFGYFSKYSMSMLSSMRISNLIEELILCPLNNDIDNILQTSSYANIDGIFTINYSKFCKSQSLNDEEKLNIVNNYIIDLSDLVIMYVNTNHKNTASYKAYIYAQSKIKTL